MFSVIREDNLEVFKKYINTVLSYCERTKQENAINSLFPVTQDANIFPTLNFLDYFSTKSESVHLLERNL